MRAFVILGCEGHQQNGFKFCNETENIILDLEKIENRDNYLDIIKYLDTMGMFESFCNKSGTISNIVYKLYTAGLIKDKLYKDISYFYNMHARCSLILYLRPKDLK